MVIVANHDIAPLMNIGVHCLLLVCADVILPGWLSIAELSIVAAFLLLFCFEFECRFVRSLDVA
jgi:hypothetical protein